MHVRDDRTGQDRIREEEVQLIRQVDRQIHRQTDGHTDRWAQYGSL